MPSSLYPILIAGPTASGKSALALALAERLDGAVINADALQVYAEWRVLTARPTPEEEARRPHLLYGHVPAATAHSVGLWLRDAEAALARCRREGLRPVFVGGSGLLFAALTEGLVEIPPPTAEIRAAAEDRLATLGREGFAAEIVARDPATAARIDCANPARLLRAWETLEMTGEGLAAHWARTPPPLAPSFHGFVVAPARAALYARCDARFDAMLERGALAEAAAVAALALPLSAPAMKALGAAELVAVTEGRVTRAEAAAAAKQATRNYAKRQLTWARNRMRDWTWLDAPDVAQALTAIEPR